MRLPRRRCLATCDEAASRHSVLKWCLEQRRVIVFLIRQLSASRDVQLISEIGNQLADASKVDTGAYAAQPFDVGTGTTYAAGGVEAGRRVDECATFGQAVDVCSRLAAIHWLGLTGVVEGLHADR